MTSGSNYPDYDGNLFSVGIDGTNYQNLVSFTGTSGSANGLHPQGSLIFAGTTLYGMTEFGGANVPNNLGNIFSVGTDGTNYQNLVSLTTFTGMANGKNPVGSLTLAGTTLYGMTENGGIGNGNIFSVGTNGTNYQNLYAFPGSGYAASPQGNLTLVGTTLYGMSEHGGPGYGNIFSIGSNGANYRNLVFFTNTSGSANGAFPTGSLTLSDTTLYGMTSDGGVYGSGNIFSVGTDGSNYQNLYSMTGGTGGSLPNGSLLLSGTTLYGMTRYGGTIGDGNIFSMGVDGSGYQDLYNFGYLTGGYQPYGDLTLSGGTLFGMAYYGGSGGVGTVFALTLPTPEPGSLALAGSAAAVVGAYRWRRRRTRWRDVGGGRRHEATPWRPLSMRRKHAGTHHRPEGACWREKSAP
jgi:hypothetical protein